LSAIESALNRAQRSGALLGLLFIDLDGFKNVNDSYGHRAGDEVLCSVATRLGDLSRGGDLVARLGGDEFVVLLENLSGETDALAVAQRIVVALPAPIPLSGGGQASVGGSVGLAISQDGSTDPHRLLHEADTAAYRAKSGGRGRVEVFDHALRRELDERAELENALGRAIEQDELVLHYQPVLDLQSDTVTGYEALVRWQRPGHGLIQPGDFIPAAEASSLICDLDRWVLRQATAQLARWDAEGLDARRTMAVNLSARHLSDRRVVDDVVDALAATGLAPHRLVVEITETVIVEDLLAIEHLSALRALGIVISLDDFGTGYNSITRLQTYPIDIVKIDRSFLHDQADSGLALLSLIVHAAHTFGLSVVAEGVETDSQLALLRRLHCRSAQGFLLGRPAPAGTDATNGSSPRPTALSSAGGPARSTAAGPSSGRTGGTPR
jgi:diguanylate cyclase (GGDEF)-like protein